MRQYCIELDVLNGKFLDIYNYFSVQKPSSKAIKITIYAKKYNLIRKQVFISITDIGRTHFYMVEICAKKKSVQFLAKNAGVYKVAACSDSWSTEFILHVQNSLSNGDEELEFEQLNMITVVPKWLGPISNWDKYLAEFSKQKFNAVYLLPFQSPGASNSPYSIVDHQQIDSSLGAEGSWDDFKDAVLQLKRRHKLLLVTDVVWNHTSKDSNWIAKHPDSGYNLSNSPHLKLAYQLDAVLQALTFYISPFVVTVENLEELSCRIKREISHAFANACQSDESLRHDLDVAIKNILLTVYYERIDPRGSRKGPITVESPIVSPYFTALGYDNRLIFANNGWVMNTEETNSFIMPESKAYFRREIVVWSDCIKLRYGHHFSDNPWLWNYMLTYTIQLASLFDGFRIDNCHSCPLEAAEFFLQEARRVNPNLFVIGELFTGSQEKDIFYVSKLGVDLLIRESLQTSTVNDVVRNSYLHSYAKPIGSFKYIRQCLPRSILMDCTHDNEPPTKYNSICNMAIVAFHNCPIGTTMGYDHLTPKRYDLTMTNFRYPGYTNAALGRLRKFLNGLHCRLAREGYKSFYSEHLEGSTIKITRENPTNHQIYEIYANYLIEHRSHKYFHMHYCKKGYHMNAVLFAAFGTNDELIFRKNAEIQILLPGQIYICQGVPCFAIPNAKTISFPQLNLVDANMLLFQHSNEGNCSSYEVPEYGKLFYCGLQSVFDVLHEAFQYNNLDHPICQNIRQGDWLIDCLCARFNDEKFKAFVAELQIVKAMPHYYKPFYLHAMVKGAHKQASKRGLLLMKMENEPKFIQHLALTSIQLLSNIKNSELTWNQCNDTPCLAAGLPHFCQGNWRCWARDTFIAFKGLFLETNRFEDAKNHILAFASCYKSGLIPNLLDSARYPRFNSRDSTWWFLYAIQEYCETMQDYTILNETVCLRFSPITEEYSAFDDSEHSYQYSKTLIEIIHEIIVRHWKGISVIEDFPFQDEKMRPKGREIQIYTNKHSGFIYGGNEFNCGTWMDKMGEDGIPATPRNGANIEIIALLHSTLIWLIKLCENGEIDRRYELIDKDCNISHWKSLIHKNFDSSFYDAKNGYYFDTLDSQPELRPNFSHTLFCTEHAINALKIIDSRLASPVAVKTLDPQHPQYKADYHCNDNAYHNGPEWLWLYGKLVIAKCIFMPDAIAENPFLTHEKILLESAAKGLPELINADGTRCEASCDSQAWSNGCILEAYRFWRRQTENK